MTTHQTKEKHSNSKPHVLSKFPDIWAWLIYGGLAIGGVVLDLWSKKAVFDWLGSPESGNVYTVIPDFFQIVSRLNAGAAFSIFQGQRLVLAGISSLALLVMLYLFLTGRFQRRIFQIAAGCITAGIVGNLYDRLFNDGLVRDFLDVYVKSYHWPTFNVADSLLCIGVGLILLANFTPGEDHKTEPRQKSES